jgi:Family of unknown function (DUF6364)
MTTKLTLQVDEELIRFGKRWAQSRGKSLSRLVSDFLAALEKTPDEGGLPPITRSLVGLAQGVDEEDYRRYLEQKYR